MQIAEIREIFTLFDKNSDGYVNTSELGNVVRALGFNPTQTEVKDMEKDVDPQGTMSFDQMNLISLIARRPKQIDSLEDMISALKTMNGGDEAGDEKKGPMKIEVASLKYNLLQMGEVLQEHEIEEILADCVDLIHEDSILIDVFANYLMAR